MKKNYVKSVKVNFATSISTIDTEDIQKVKVDIKVLEPAVSLHESKQKHESFEVKLELIKLGVYIVLFLVAILITDYTSYNYLGLALLW